MIIRNKGKIFFAFFVIGADSSKASSSLGDHSQGLTSAKPVLEKTIVMTTNQASVAQTSSTQVKPAPQKEGTPKVAQAAKPSPAKVAVVQAAKPSPAKVAVAQASKSSQPPVSSSVKKENPSVKKAIPPKAQEIKVDAQKKETPHKVQQNAPKPPPQQTVDLKKIALHSAKKIAEDALNQVTECRAILTRCETEGALYPILTSQKNSNGVCMADPASIEKAKKICKTLKGKIKTTIGGLKVETWEYEDSFNKDAEKTGQQKNKEHVAPKKLDGRIDKTQNVVKTWKDAIFGTLSSTGVYTAKKFVK